MTTDVSASHQPGKPGAVKKLPDDLAAMDMSELVQQRALRDEVLAPLFRRWPALSRIELRALRGAYGERLRIAKHLGGRRRRTR